MCPSNQNFSIENKGMKKIISIAASAVIALSFVTPAQAEEAKSLVIVDSYFDVSKIAGKVESVCVAVSGCELTPTPQSGFSDAYNHGTAMAEVALKQNPNIKLVLVRAASATKNNRTGVVSISTLNGNDFLKSLSYVSSRSDVGAVSFSYNLSGNKTCSLSTTGGVNVRVVEPQIQSTISSLKAKGVPVWNLVTIQQAAGIDLSL